MSKVRFTGAGLRWPKWTTHDMWRVTPTISNITLAANASAAIHCIGAVEWADGGTHDISAIKFRTASYTPSYTLRVSLQDPSTVAGPPGRADGSVDQSVTIVDPTVTTSYTATLGANRTNVAHGATIAVVFDYSAYSSGTFVMPGIGISAVTGYSLRPTLTTYDGATYTASVGAIPALTIVASDGTLGQFADAFPATAAGTLTTYTFNSGSTPDEHANEFTVTHKMWCGGASVHVNAAASADFDIVLYSGTDALQTVSVVTDTLSADAAPRWITVAWPDTALSPGTTYRLALKPTTANNVAITSYATPTSGDLQAFIGTVGYTTRTDAGSWAAVTATRALFMSLAIVAVDDEEISTGAYSLSGTVLDGVTPVQSATVRVIDRTTGQTTTDTTDVNGDWSVSVESNAAGRYAAYVEYENGGTKYQALAPWSITAA